MGLVPPRFARLEPLADGQLLRACLWPSVVRIVLPELRSSLGAGCFKLDPAQARALDRWRHQHGPCRSGRSVLAYRLFNARDFTDLAYGSAPRAAVLSWDGAAA